MDFIFSNEDKIKVYAQIQMNLFNLPVNVTDDEINSVISQIPHSFLEEKTELMMICQIFAYYARNCINLHKRNAILLFEKIINHMKAHLQDESSFFWNIFGGLLYFKLWMYEEGLIKIELIIKKTRFKDSLYIAEYFLPEIIEKYPEIYEKEIKQKIQPSCNSDYYLNEHKKLRKKYFKWLRDSNDYDDPIYKEIEKDKLRFSIKKDDIDTFQKLLSNLNLSVNSTISDSIIENHFYIPHEISLIEFAAFYNAFKIFKFLVMKNATFCQQLISHPIRNRNYEMFHIVENHLNSESENDNSHIIRYFYDSIWYWNDDMTEYVLNNYDFSFLEKSGIDEEYDEKALVLFQCICYSCNFHFFESIFLPFLRKNPLFVKRNIYKILMKTFGEMTGYFTEEFMKFPVIDINHVENDDNAFLVDAIKSDNMKAVEIFLNHPDIDINSDGNHNYHPLMFVCAYHKEMKMLKMFCDHPKIQINHKSERYQMTAFQLSVIKGNTFAIDYFIRNFQFKWEEKINIIFIKCFTQNLLYAIEVTLKHYMIKYKNKSKYFIFNEFNKKASILGHSQFVDKFKEIMDQIDITEFVPPEVLPKKIEYQDNEKK